MGESMRFTTASGAVYDLYEVEGDTYITRDSEIPVLDRGTGLPFPTIVGHRVTVLNGPTVGESFVATGHEVGYLTSTPVVSIDPDPEV
jgi:hypothetical protein